MRTAQQIYDTVVEKLRLQNQKSMGPGGGCRYRGDDDTKCAVGHLIPDEVYQPSMEGVSVGGLLIKNGTTVQGHVITNALEWNFSVDMREEFQTHIVLLGRLQRTHDLEPIANWEDSFRRVAETHSLIYTAPTEVQS